MPRLPYLHKIPFKKMLQAILVAILYQNFLSLNPNFDYDDTL